MPGIAQPRVTTGAAPGYVDDAVCATCHESIAKSYRAVGMSRSFSRARRDLSVEAFGDASRFTHVASHRTYEMVWRGDRLVFRRYQVDATGAQRNVLEQPVDWILGSGNHARTYLYRTPSGELFQLPVAWYSGENRFFMAPGYDRADHEEVGRRVRRECMFCHNAYPDVPAGSDARGAPQTFPAVLPEGTGCQRCHGPGGEHARLAVGGAEADEVRRAIVNPAKLAPERRDDVCYQCHLQPSVAIPGTRRFGRADYSFRPGQALGEYQVPIDIDDGEAPGARFEINHHPYRLRSSRCAQASATRLSCLGCHDPHRKVPPAERAAHYRAVCLGCHDAAGVEEKHRAAAAPPLALGADADCVSCHMPRRRPRDVVHTVMTEHRIGVYREPAALVAPLEETEPGILDVRLYGLPPAPSGTEADLYRALAAVSAGGAGVPSAIDALARLTAARDRRDVEPYYELAPAFLRRGALDLAERAIAVLLAANPADPLALDWQATLRVRQGRLEEAAAQLLDLARRLPNQAETQFNLGRVLLAQGKASEARAALERAALLRPNLVPAWFRLAEVCRSSGDRRGEENALRRALSVDPGQGEIYLALARALAADRRSREAESLLRFAKTVARHPESIPEHAMLEP